MEAIKRLRKEKSLSVKAMAGLLDCSEDLIYRIERSEKNVTKARAVKLEEMSGVPCAAWLWPDKYFNKYWPEVYSEDNVSC